MSLRRFLTPPAPIVIVLPDTRFFTSIIPVDPASTREMVASQVELTLETNSPFPAAQLYYGYLWHPGAESALIYAAYRKRFLSDESDLWPKAEIVLPALAIAAAIPAHNGAVRVIHHEDSITLLRWANDDRLPAEVSIHPLTDETQRPLLREKLTKGLKGFEEWENFEYIPENSTEKSWAFSIGGSMLSLSTADTDALDVRDKEIMKLRLRDRKRNTILWRALLVLCAILLLCGILQLSLFIANRILDAKKSQLDERTPKVEEIEKADTLTRQIERLSTQRLMPMEMLNILREQRPDNTQLTSARIEHINTILAEVRSTAVNETEQFRKNLEKQSSVSEVIIRNTHIRDGVTTYSLEVKFKPDSVYPGGEAPPPPPAPKPSTPAPVQQTTAPDDDDDEDIPAPPPPAPGLGDIPGPPSQENDVEETTTTITTVTEETTTVETPPQAEAPPPPAEEADPAPLSNSSEELILRE